MSRVNATPVRQPDMCLLPECGREADLKLVYGVDVGEAASARRRAPTLFERTRHRVGAVLRQPLVPLEGLGLANTRSCANLPDKGA